MQYQKTIVLKDGRTCILRNAVAEDGAAVLENFILTHSETDYLTTYPEEVKFTVAQEAELMQKKADSSNAIELVAEVDGRIVGVSGIDPVRVCIKMKHRANFGISLEKAFWGLGIGDAMTKACIECAKAAGYAQLELGVYDSNVRARRLYEKNGFQAYGVQPRAFRLKDGTDFDEVIMVRMLDGE